MNNPEPRTQQDLHLQANYPPISEKQPAQDKPAKSAKLMKAFALIKHFTTLGTALRCLGVISIAAGLLVFLANGYQNIDHSARFWWLIALTAIIQAIGLGMARYSSDHKGARTLLGLGLLAVPTCFAVLGAFVFSISSLENSSRLYPEIFHWQALEPIQVVIAGIVCSLVTAFVSWTGFSVLSRETRLPLTTAMMLCSALLVLPVRESIGMIPIALTMAAICYVTLMRYVLPKLKLKTHWSNLAIIFTWIPAIILVARDLFFYNAPLAVMLACAAGLHFLFWRLGRTIHNRLRIALDMLMICSGFALVYYLAAILISATHGQSGMVYYNFFHWHTSMLLVPALVLGLIIQLDLTIANRTLARIARGLFSISLATQLLVLSKFQELAILHWSIFIAFAFSLAAYGTMRRSWFLTFTGVVSVLLLVAPQLENLKALVTDVSLGGAAIFGILCIVGAHQLERHGPLLRARLESWRADKKVLTAVDHNVATPAVSEQ